MHNNINKNRRTLILLFNILIISLISSYSWAVPLLKEHDQYKSFPQQAQKAYEKKNFRQAHYLLLISCGTIANYGCGQLLDLFTGKGVDASRSYFMNKPLAIAQPEPQGEIAYLYNRNISPFEYLARQIKWPESTRWKLTMKLYPLKDELYGFKTGYLVTAQWLNEAQQLHIYASVYKYAPSAGGGMENYYISHNILNGRAFSSTFVDGLLEIPEELPVRWGSGRDVLMEKAPWDKKLNTLPALIRAMEYGMYQLRSHVFRLPVFGNNGQSTGRRKVHSWVWQIHEVENLGEKVLAQVYIKKTGTKYDVIYYTFKGNDAHQYLLTRLQYNSETPSNTVEVDFAAKCARGPDKNKIVPKCP